MHKNIFGLILEVVGPKQFAGTVAEFEFDTTNPSLGNAFLGVAPTCPSIVQSICLKCKIKDIKDIDLDS